MTLAGLAGVMAAAAHDDTLLYSLEGSTSTAKSSSQMLAVAHFHDPALKAGGQFVSAKGTTNSHEIPLERGSGTVTAFDEISTMPAEEQEEFVFTIQQGNAKRRMTQTGAERKGRNWVGGMVSFSAETGMAQRMASANVTQRGGLSVRVLPILTSADTRLSEEEWSAVEQMHGNFGHSGPAFIEGLKVRGHLDDPSELKSKVNSLVELLDGTTGNVQKARAARQVAYMWAAGIVAQDLGLIPATFNVEQLAQKVWKDALKSELAPEDPAARAARTLLDNLIAFKGGQIRPFADKDKGYSECVGYFGAVLESENVFVIRANKITELAGRAVGIKPLLKKLDELGILVPSKRNRTWDGFSGLGKSQQYVVLRSSMIEG
jgi:hypothetical protein